MALIAAASEASGMVHCTVYTSQGEAAVSRLGLPLPQVYSWLKINTVQLCCCSVILRHSGRYTVTKKVAQWPHNPPYTPPYYFLSNKPSVVYLLKIILLN